MKSAVFNSLLMIVTVLAAYSSMRALADRKALAKQVVQLRYRPVSLPPAGPLRVAGAWVLEAGDPRFGGLSALALDQGQFLAVSDLGAVARFDLPSSKHPRAELRDLRIGPGRFGKKWTRDAESLARDSHGRGWWIGYEQHHSLWLYDEQFNRSLATVDLDRPDWRDNRGAEGLVAESRTLLVTAENGREAMRVGAGGIKRLPMAAGAEVADAALAPDGSAWLLLRSKGVHGIGQSIAPLLRNAAGYRAGPGWPVPKAPLDNYEGLAIAKLPSGAWRFWLVTDDGHRVRARTLLTALDYRPGVRNDKGPATGARPLKKPLDGTP